MRIDGRNRFCYGFSIHCILVPPPSVSLIKFESGSHWYDCRGKAPAPSHDADLRVARKKLLYPSPTSIDKEEFRNMFLERWSMNQLAEAAGENYKQPHESPEDYAQRLYQLSLEYAKNAADFGSRLHKAIDSYPLYPSDHILHPWMDKFGEWRGANIRNTLSTEEIVYDHDLGVAGTCDFYGEGCGELPEGLIVADWKSQNVKKDDKGRKKPMYYDSWIRQLSFYSVCLAKKAGTFPDQLPTCVSGVFDSNEPERPFIKVWSKQETISGYEDFVIACYRWFKKRGFWPQPSGPFSISCSLRMPS